MTSRPRRRRSNRLMLSLTASVLSLTLVPAFAGPSVREKTANLDIALRVRSILRSAGVSVSMTRASDRTLVPDSRTGLANGKHVDAFVSIHNNWASDDHVRGTWVFHSLRRGGSLSLGDDIRDAMTSEFGRARPARLTSRRGAHGDYYYQLRETTMAAVLVECAFVSNPSEARALATSPSFRAKIAGAIARGILSYQKSLVRHRAPRLDPGQTQQGPLPAPTQGTANALGATRVALSWTAAPLLDTYRVYRNGRLIAVRHGGPGARMRLTDVWGAPGQHYRYEVRGVQHVAGINVESEPLSLTARTPAISIVLDPGHGGRDPGAIGHY